MDRLSVVCGVAYGGHQAEKLVKRGGTGGGPRIGVEDSRTLCRLRPITTALF